MTDASPDDLARLQQLSERFGRFCDGVISHITIETEPHRLTIDIECRENSVNGGWFTCQFVVQGHVEYRFEQPWNQQNLVLSNGLAIHTDDGGIFLNFEPGADEIVTTEFARSSPMFAAGESVVATLTLAAPSAPDGPLDQQP